MKTWLRLILFAGLTLAVLPAPVALGQQGNNPPTIEIIAWEVFRDSGVETVFDLYAGIGSVFDIPVFQHQEYDFVFVTVEVFDQDWTEDNYDIVDGVLVFDDVSDAVYLRFQAFGLWFYAPPEPPPIVDADDNFFGATADDGFGPNTFVPGGDPTNPEDLRLVYTFAFVVPEFLGKNQSRLRGEIDFDVAWELWFSAANEDAPEDERTVGTEIIDVIAIENPAMAPVNPPAFADAGADRTVPAGFEVVLDGSRSFDSFNVGFDETDDEDIFEKDRLTFTWEWISGPVRVDPVQTDAHDPMATVLLTVPDPNEPYVYRLLVDDNVNGLPDSDSVAITVVEELPEKNPPVAVIEGPASARTIGSTITLVSRSTDPDHPEDTEGELLSYRWQQTNELGDALDPDELQDAFQPLSGATEKTLTWQALIPGTFYFRLLVDDGDFRSSARFSVKIIETATGGASETADGGDTMLSSGAANGDNSGLQQNVTAPALCGAGVLPLAAVPFALIAWWRRLR